MSLYQTLGVERDADHNTIKRAYRKLIKDLHPDRGGDPVQFRDAQLAWEVLSDPERRKRYDETGRTDEARDNTLQMIATFVNQVLDQIISETGPFGAINPNKNVRDEVLRHIRSHRRGLDETLARANSQVAVVQRMLERFKLKDPTGADVIGAALGDKLRKAQHDVRVAEGAIKLANDAIELFNRYEYEQVNPTPEEGRNSGAGFTSRQLLGGTVKFDWR